MDSTYRMSSCCHGYRCRVDTGTRIHIIPKVLLLCHYRTSSRNQETIFSPLLITAARGEKNSEVLARLSHTMEINFNSQWRRFVRTPVTQYHTYVKYLWIAHRRKTRYTADTIIVARNDPQPTARVCQLMNCRRRRRCQSPRNVRPATFRTLGVALGYSPRASSQSCRKKKKKKYPENILQSIVIETMWLEVQTNLSRLSACFNPAREIWRITRKIAEGS